MRDTPVNCIRVRRECRIGAIRMMTSEPRPRKFEIRPTFVHEPGIHGAGLTDRRQAIRSDHSLKMSDEEALSAQASGKKIPKIVCDLKTVARADML